MIPYKSRVRLLNLDQKDNLQTQINKWLVVGGVIEPSVSPWVSPLVPVKKKDEPDEMGHRSKGAEKADDQGQLPPHDYTGDPS